MPNPSQVLWSHYQHITRHTAVEMGRTSYPLCQWWHIGPSRKKKSVMAEKKTSPLGRWKFIPHFRKVISLADHSVSTCWDVNPQDRRKEIRLLQAWKVNLARYFTRGLCSLVSMKTGFERTCLFHPSSLLSGPWVRSWSVVSCQRIPGISHDVIVLKPRIGFFLAYSQSRGGPKHE
jgi:hypothetical protein